MTPLGLHQLGTGRRASRVSDGQGGWTRTWSETVADVRCKLDLAQSGTEQQLADSKRQKASGTLYVPADTDIARDDEWTITRGVIDPLTVLVLQVTSPGGRPYTFAPHLEVSVKQIQEGT